MKSGQIRWPARGEDGQSSGVSAHSDITAHPLSVASSYALFNPGFKRSAYSYDSDWGYADHLSCSSKCVVIDQWQTRVHEAVQGGTSKSWVITLNARHVSGSSPVHFGYWYACAVNVGGGNPDHYCSSGHGADVSPQAGVRNPSQQIHRYFEKNNYSNVEYPMAGISVYFPGGSITNRNRGADTCTTAKTASLCGVTGNGTGGTHRW